jgi:hypothetical protein
MAAHVEFIRLDLEYVYISRLTWSLAAIDPGRLAETPWLFNSFIKSNAADVSTCQGRRYSAAPAKPSRSRV